MRFGVRDMGKKIAGQSFPPVTQRFREVEMANEGTARGVALSDYHTARPAGAADSRETFSLGTA